MAGMEKLKIPLRELEAKLRVAFDAKPITRGVRFCVIRQPHPKLASNWQLGVAADTTIVVANEARDIAAEVAGTFELADD